MKHRKTAKRQLMFSVTDAEYSTIYNEARARSVTGAELVRRYYDRGRAIDQQEARFTELAAHIARLETRIEQLLVSIQHPEIRTCPEFRIGPH